MEAYSRFRVIALCARPFNRSRYVGCHTAIRVERKRLSSACAVHFKAARRAVVARARPRDAERRRAHANRNRSDEQARLNLSQSPNQCLSPTASPVQRLASAFPRASISLTANIAKPKFDSSLVAVRHPFTPPQGP